MLTRQLYKEASGKVVGVLDGVLVGVPDGVLDGVLVGVLNDERVAYAAGTWCVPSSEHRHTWLPCQVLGSTGLLGLCPSYVIVRYISLALRSWVPFGFFGNVGTSGSFFLHM